jgi:hypothetical protein
MNSNVTPDQVRDLARRLVATNYHPDVQGKSRLTHAFVANHGRIQGICQAADALGIVPTPFFLEHALSIAIARVTQARGERPGRGAFNADIRAFDSAVIDVVCEFVLSGEIVL